MKKIILAITGASGSIYGIKALNYLLEQDYQVDLILSKSALLVMKHELDLELTQMVKHEKLIIHDVENLAARCASGSNQALGMLILPCSMGTIGRIANGISDDLISRTADVMLKERKKLLVLFREAPLNSIHLKNLLTLSEAGAIVVPASPAFYHKPKDISEQIDFILGKVFDVLGIENNLFKRWT